MWKLSESELREFGKHGYVVVRDVIPPVIFAAAATAIDHLVDKEPPPEGYVGHHFYWLSTHDGTPLPALFYDTPLRSLAQSLVDPGEIEIAFDQLQVALKYSSILASPWWSSLGRLPGGPPDSRDVHDACWCAHDGAADRKRRKPVGVAWDPSDPCGVLSRARSRSAGGV